MRRFIRIVTIPGVIFAISLSLPFHLDSEKWALAAGGRPIGMAVEFMDHAACAYIAQEKGWFEHEKLGILSYRSYITGMAMASALARGDIQVAYICLVPAINAYANGKVPIRVVAGTHKYGYGLSVNPERVKTLKDLEKPGIRIGCVREGGAVDVFFHRVIDSHGLNEAKLSHKVQRMNPPKQCWAVKTGKLDAAFLPEQWATMTEDMGFRMLLTSQDVWHEMQGSVLVVKEELIRTDPMVVRGLVKVTQRATDYLHQHRDEAARIMARHLSIAGEKTFPLKAAQIAGSLDVTPGMLKRSMARLQYTTSLDPLAIQEMIDNIYHLGYIKHSFKAEDILDLRFLR
jgi:NitT/TauT family transport system substrate-binding protein